MSRQSRYRTAAARELDDSEVEVPVVFNRALRMRDRLRRGIKPVPKFRAHSSPETEQRRGRE